MAVKVIVASMIVAAALVFGAASFVETNIEYADFQYALTSHRKVQVKGEWLSDKGSAFDAARGTFQFMMVDERGRESKVIFDGAEPNNFELAQSIVVKGKYENGLFHATEILTKCSSKYESKPEFSKE